MFDDDLNYIHSSDQPHFVLQSIADLLRPINSWYLTHKPECYDCGQNENQVREGMLEWIRFSAEFNHFRFLSMITTCVIRRLECQLQFFFQKSRKFNKNYFGLDGNFVESSVKTQTESLNTQHGIDKFTTALCDERNRNDFHKTLVGTIAEI